MNLSERQDWKAEHRAYETRFNELLQKVARQVATCLMSDHETPAIYVQMWEPDMYIRVDVSIDRSPSFPRAPKVGKPTLEEVEP